MSGTPEKARCTGSIERTLCNRMISHCLSNGIDRGWLVGAGVVLAAGSYGLESLESFYLAFRTDGASFEVETQNALMRIGISWIVVLQSTGSLYTETHRLRSIPADYTVGPRVALLTASSGLIRTKYFEMQKHGLPLDKPWNCGCMKASKSQYVNIGTDLLM